MSLLEFKSTIYYVKFWKIILEVGYLYDVTVRLSVPLYLTNLA